MEKRPSQPESMHDLHCAFTGIEPVIKDDKKHYKVLSSRLLLVITALFAVE